MAYGLVQHPQESTTFHPEQGDMTVSGISLSPEARKDVDLAAAELRKYGFLTGMTDQRILDHVAKRTREGQAALEDENGNGLIDDLQLQPGEEEDDQAVATRDDDDDDDDKELTREERIALEQQRERERSRARLRVEPVKVLPDSVKQEKKKTDDKNDRTNPEADAAVFNNRSTRSFREEEKQRREQRRHEKAEKHAPVPHDPNDHTNWHYKTNSSRNDTNPQDPNDHSFSQRASHKHDPQDHTH
jgi:hypothetical protein